MRTRNEGAERRPPGGRGWPGSLRRATLALAACTGLVLGLAGPVQAAPAARPMPPTAGSQPEQKIQPELAGQLETKNAADFFVRFEARTDLSKASGIDDWAKRGAYVVKQLKRTAEHSQRRSRKLLERADVEHESFWISNTILVEGGSARLAERVAAQPAVARLHAVHEYKIPKPQPGKAQERINAVEWGIANIRADEVWRDFGVRGEGLVVASIDSGVQYDHPALVRKYRGNEGNGDFDHNYNWFDPSDICDGDAPCDNQGHGTHTMGTMVGGDGANQIGVAPEAQWIAAKGCESRTCSSAALLSSAQWMLAPTDTSGDDPRPELRPDIVNNSWGGANGPVEDPWFDDVIEAWTASGIFGVFSNGNSGHLGCDTTGSPADSDVAYGVGGYTIDNDIYARSSRGPGEDGQIKPNISAPGVNVRSSVPGDGYIAYTGTSMAAPHLSGAVALMWSAAPALEGDIEGTRQILDETARDVRDLSCGGTADDNNVWGEGRLDAYAAVSASPLGNTGTLAGAVTDAETGEPVEDATVEVSSSGFERTTITGSEGGYEVRLPVGTYGIAVSYFGYKDATATVEVTQGGTTTRDFSLEPKQAVVLSGNVTDGSGHGWPLYARVSVEGMPGGTTYTNPRSGRYHIELPANGAYTIQVQSQYPGYEELVTEVEVGTSDELRNLHLTVDAEMCVAPGYEHRADGLFEDFSSTGAPEGWTVADNLGNGQVWRFDDPGGRGNQTGGDDGFAIVDSDQYGSGSEQDTSLISPVIDLSGFDSPTLRFNQDYYNLGDTADVDVSLDGGETWDTVLHQSSDRRGPRETVVQLPQAAGHPDVRVRFHYYEATWDWWWQVDNVLVGTLTCVPTHGGLVVGNVRDANDGAGLIGATVTSADEPAETATTVATSGDTELDDGFYWLFSPATGPHEFTASKAGYGSRTKRARVPTNWVQEVNFALPAGRLGVEPGSIDVTQQMGEHVRRSLRVTNTGGDAVEVTVAERGGDFVIQRPDGTKTSLDRMARRKGAPLQRLKGHFTPRQHVQKSRIGSGSSSKAPAARAGTPYAPPWTATTDYPTPIMDNAVAYHDGKVYSVGGTTSGQGATAAAYVYDPSGRQWSPIADLPEPRQGAAAAFIGGRLYVAGGWGADGATGTLYIYDLAGDSWTQGAEMPATRSAAGVAVLDGELYVVGGCTNGACNPSASSAFRYDPSGDSWEAVADYAAPLAFLACGGVSGRVVCSGGVNGSTSAGSTATYSYNPGTDRWTARADLPIDLWAMGYASANGKLLISGGVTNDGTAVTNRGFAYDPAAGGWTELPNANNAVYRGGAACGFYKIGGSTGNFDATPYGELLPGYAQCGGGGVDVPWLSADPVKFTVAAGGSQQVTVTLDAGVVAQPGTYTAALAINENTPYSVEPVRVSMHATPPDTWGKITGTVTGQGCDGSTAPIGGATVQLDSWARNLTMKTDDQGRYARWIDYRNSPFRMIVAKDGYAPTARESSVERGATTVENFMLKEALCS